MFVCLCVVVVVVIFIFIFLFYYLVGVANRHSSDADRSQVDNLETLIGSRALYFDHVLLRGYVSSVQINGNCMKLWFGLVRSVRSTSR